MSYSRDKDANTRGPGAIAAADHGNPRRMAMRLAKQRRSAAIDADRALLTFGPHGGVGDDAPVARGRGPSKPVPPPPPPFGFTRTRRGSYSYGDKPPPAGTMGTGSAPTPRPPQPPAPAGTFGYAPVPPPAPAGTFGYAPVPPPAPATTPTPSAPASRRPRRWYDRSGSGGRVQPLPPPPPPDGGVPYRPEFFDAPVVLEPIPVVPEVAPPSNSRRNLYILLAIVGGVYLYTRNEE